jgi:phosphoribosylformylglycinamidine cyclo-ligase
LPRVFPRGMQAEIELGSWPVPPIFSYLAGLGKLERDELLRTFNMGVGMILVVPIEHHKALEAELKRRREKFYRIGEVRRADPRKPQVVFTGKLPL